jgi:hypothetical protein
MQVGKIRLPLQAIPEAGEINLWPMAPEPASGFLADSASPTLVENSARFASSREELRRRDYT